MQDSELLSLLTHNPEKGLSRLMDQYAALVYAIVRGKLANSGTDEDIEECVSDIFLDFYDSVTHINLTKGSLKAYLCVIAKRKAIDRYRRLIRQPDKLSTDEVDWAEPADHNANVEEAFAARLARQNLMECICSLGNRMRKFLFVNIISVRAPER